MFQVAALTMDLDLGIISESEKRLKKKLILDYIYSNLKHHNFWAYRYFFCELLALMNVVGRFLGFIDNLWSTIFDKLGSTIFVR